MHFDFEGIVLTPGRKYVIDWIPPSGAVLSWMVRDDNPYSGGNAFGCTGLASSNNDRNFQTYVATTIQPIPIPSLDSWGVISLLGLIAGTLCWSLLMRKRRTTGGNS